MSIDEEDARREEWLLSLYQEHSAQALAEFRGERLRSYYLEHPDILQLPSKCLLEARGLIETSPSAALVLASAAAEVGVKSALLKPVVFGLVHSESMATYVTELALEHRDLNRFRGLLFALLREACDIDLTEYWRDGDAASLWERFKSNARKRNAVVHRCGEVDRGDAEEAVDIATAVLDDLIPTIIASFDLHIHKDFQVCARHRCDLALHPFFGHA